MPIVPLILAALGALIAAAAAILAAIATNKADDAAKAKAKAQDKLSKGAAGDPCPECEEKKRQADADKKAAENTPRNVSTASNSEKRPELEELAKDPVVSAAIDKAWADSNPNGGGPKMEHGFWIQKDSDGKTVIVPFGGSDSTNDHMVPGSPPQNGNTTVGFFHTHPNTAAEGYVSEPSDADESFANYYNVPGIIQSHDGMYYFGPSK